MQKILTIFAGYDRDNIIDDYVVYYIKELNKISDVIYVSDCNMLDNELKKIDNHCIHIINGRHGEYDFGSYKRGYLYAKENNILQNYDKIIFCNDSCYGPFFNLENIIYKITDYNFGGIYISKDLKIAEHDYITSFFIIIDKKIYNTNFFNNFILNIKKEPDKMDIIKKYEFGLSKLMLDNNIELQAIFNDNGKFNRPYFSPLSLIEEGFPLLKRHILEKKITVPLNIDELKTILNIIKNNYDIKLIVNHLNRIADKNQIKYLFQKYKPYKKAFINEKLFCLFTRYSPSGKYQTVYKIFNSITISIEKPIKDSYIETNYKDFNFLLEI
ncbi:rhamnan synthesis F family protein [Brachyspira pilosicoli]|uniref:rhamnan synthesis F family protein n=1 Tax=Brachyspira pilosicoli TaxID=52584 RepID=UPI0030079DC9